MITIHPTQRGYVFRWGPHESREYRLFRSALRAAMLFAARTGRSVGSM